MPDVHVQQKTQQATKDPISLGKKDQSSEMQLQFRAQALVERLLRSREEVKELKNALKAYKVTSEKLDTLKKARKKYTEEINDEKALIEGRFQKDKTYNELREKVLDHEEKIAVSKQDLRILLREQALKNEFVELTLEVDGQPLKLQSQAKVALYLNGKEEK